LGAVFILTRQVLPETDKPIPVANKALDLAVFRLVVRAKEAESSYIAVSLHCSQGMLCIQNVFFSVIYQRALLFSLVVEFVVCWLLYFDLSSFATVSNAPNSYALIS